jgi:transcriptional regulator NrdR family protein
MITWICVWCNVEKTGIQGSRFQVFKRKFRRRKCADCVAKETTGGAASTPQAPQTPKAGLQPTP